jgi:hypothetical protein
VLVSVLNPGEIAGIGAGAAGVLAGGVWFVIARHRRRRIDSALSDPNPMTRIATLDLLVQSGLPGHLAALVDRVLLEDDPRVQTVLARTIKRTRWDANVDQRLLRLRTWATRVGATPATPSSEPAIAAVSETGPTPGDDEVVGALVAGHQPDGSTASADPRREAEFETLEENEQRVMDWLLSPDPVSSAPHAQSPGSGRGPGPPRADRSFSVVKAEQRAIALLRDAGYGVIPKGVPGAAGSETESPSQDRATTVSEEARLLRQLGAEQAVRLNLLEQMIRRVQAENARLEAELWSFSEHTDG